MAVIVVSPYLLVLFMVTLPSLSTVAMSVLLLVYEISASAIIVLSAYTLALGDAKSVVP